MNDLLQKLESYNWTDELGHPLVNCVEWEEFKKRANANDLVIKLMQDLVRLLENPFEEPAKSKWQERIAEMQKKQAEKMNNVR